MNETDTDTNKDDEFYEMADAFIALANKQSKEVIQGKVSATFLYAAARFNTFLVASNSESKLEFESGIKSSIEYFMAEYKKMLEEHFEDYNVNYETYIEPKLQS
ncbi:MAG: DUF3144 domain-containing protein [Thiohalomonadales bacterium]